MNKIQFYNNQIVVSCERLDAETLRIINENVDLYPVHSNRIKTEFKFSPRLVPEVLRCFRGITDENIGDAPIGVQQAYYAEMRRRRALAELKETGPVGNPTVNGLITLEPHQQLGREIAQVFDKFAFFYDTRTGKTPMSLSIIRDDVLQHPGNKWLVVCPLILIENAWMQDAERFFPELRVVNCHAATKAKRLEQIAKDADVYITNTESFVTYNQYFADKNIVGAFVDESSDMKSPKSKISKALVEYAQHCKRFYLLSGTPAPNGEQEYFMQMRAIDYFCMPQSYTQFKEHFFTNTSWNPQYEKLAIKQDRKEELMSLIKSRALYVDKEDVLDTPGRTFHEVIVDMPNDVLKAYRTMKNKMSMSVGPENKITATSAAAMLNKLNQISSGFVMDTQAAKENVFYDEHKQEWYLLNDFRFTALLELLDSPALCGQQVLIWANYRVEFQQIKELLGDTCRCIYGGTTIEEKNEAIRLFKEGKVQYLVANPASADKGLTLTNAHICVYFSLNWSYELYKQSMERIYGAKRSQPLHCHYYVMMCEGTVDTMLYREVLETKASVSTAVLNHLKGGV